MQSVSTRRLNPTPHVAVIAIAISLAILAGIVALEVTDNFPGRGESASQVVLAPAIISESAGEGQVSPRHLEAILGAGATLDSVNPTIKGDRSAGQGEGLVGPGALSNLATVSGSSADRADMIAGIARTLDPVMTSEQMFFLEQNGVILNEAAPAATSIEQYIAGPFNEGYIGETTPAPAEYVADPYQGGPTEQ